MKLTVNNSKTIAAVLLLSILVILIGIFVLSVSRVGPLEAELNSYTHEPTGEKDRFQVMNLNMLHGFPDFEHLKDRLILLADQINQISPDIVTLQEVPWSWQIGSTAEYLAKRTGMNYVYLPANGNRWAIFFSEGEAILSKFELKDIAFKELVPSAGFFEHRVALKATAVTSWGDINILSTHLTHGDPAINRAQAQDLTEFVGQFVDQTTIIGGDFNALEVSSQIRSLSANWMDTYRKANPLEQGFTCCLSELTGPGIDIELEKRIDYLFLIPYPKTPDVSIISSQTVLDHPYNLDEAQLWISDHIGVLTIFEIIE